MSGAPKVEWSERAMTAAASDPDLENQASRSVQSGKTIRVLMAAGGTGGHIFPLLAIAQELKTPGAAEVEFVGAGRALEKQIISGAGFPLREVRVAGLKGIHGWKAIQNLMLLPLGALDTLAVLVRSKPHVVVGIGGYVAGPALLEAALAGIPTLLIEPNAQPGFTNRVLAPVVRRAAVGFESAARFYGSKSQLTGHPVRREFFSVPPMPLPPPMTLLIVGGSQGARAINSLMIESLDRMKPHVSRWKIIHQTGGPDLSRVQEAYHRQGISAEVHAFITDMPRALARAHLAISRAGASTLAELTAAGRPSLLIPFPAATDQHQLINALEVERVGAARILQEREATPERFTQMVRDLMENPGELNQMGKRARTLAHPDAAGRIAQMIMELGDPQNRKIRLSGD